MLLERNTFFVKERVAFAKLTDIYDILDPETKQQLGIAKEEPAGWAKWLRLLVNKLMLPTKVNLYESENQPPLFSIRVGPFRHSVVIIGGDGKILGSFKTKLFSLGGAFRVLDAQGQQFAEIKGDWKGWNFKFLSTSGQELGVVTKKWAGIGRELFTSADQYIISLNDSVGSKPIARILLLAAGLAIDTVFKEKK